MDGPRILLIDDDAALCAVIVEYLAGFGFAVDVAGTPSAGLARLAAGGVDLVLLDVMLPERDGFTVCREIVSDTAAYGRVPVILLTARGDVIDRVVGLELGAEDYLSKPFEPRELVARIRTVLRRGGALAPLAQPVPGQPVPGRTRTVRGLVLDTAACDAWLDGDRLNLTTLEYDLLALLSTDPGRVFSRDDIMDALRGIDADIFSRSVDVLVSRLRGKLNDTAKPPRFIRTVWGRGYAFLKEDRL